MNKVTDSILKDKEEIIISNVSDTYEIGFNINFRVKKIIELICILITFLIVYFIAFNSNKNIFNEENKVEISNIKVLSYNVEINEISLSILPSTEQKYCALESNNGLNFIELDSGECHLSVSFNEQYVYFKNKRDKLSNKVKVSDYIVDLNLKDNYYLALGDKVEFSDEILVVGEPKYYFTGMNDVVSLSNDEFIANKEGSSKVSIMLNDKVIKELNIVVTDTIVKMPKEFNYDKKFLSCKKYTYDEAMLLDKILESRIEDAGYGTRAGAVAAARFLTLEFPYRISYYWENGRLNDTGTHYVDGEGRYYHKGLYLDKSKYEDIEASLFGPAMWGCLMRSYEDDPPYYVPGGKYPNGLDCSGFVTWTLYNGGFDVGDIGAGESPGPGQLTDVGEFKKITKELINSGKIKVGDLFNFWGHISIIVGIDENNYYVAESLNTYRGLVVKKYSKKKVMNTFKYVVLMEDYYKGDGKLTNMWY